MHLADTNPQEIIVTVKRLISSFRGIDDISSKIIKEIIKEIAAPLSSIFSLSVRTGQFPISLKIAEIVPVFKSDVRFSN